MAREKTRAPVVGRFPWGGQRKNPGTLAHAPTQKMKKKRPLGWNPRRGKGGGTGAPPETGRKLTPGWTVGGRLVRNGEDRMLIEKKKKT